LKTKSAKKRKKGGQRVLSPDRGSDGPAEKPGKGRRHTQTQQEGNMTRGEPKEVKLLERKEKRKTVKSPSLNGV